MFDLRIVSLEKEFITSFKCGAVPSKGDSIIINKDRVCLVDSKFFSVENPQAVVIVVTEVNIS